MAISLKCSCGKTLKVDEKHRGKKAKCPACGNTLLVEEQDAETAVQAEEPMKRRAAARDDDDNGDEDEPEVRRPIKKKAAAKSNRMMYIIGGGCGLLLLLTCCVSGVGVGVWYFFFRGDDDDLKYVHEGVAGFVSIRSADMWKSSVVQDQLKQLPPEMKKGMDDKLKEMETQGGLKIDDIERITLIFRSTNIKEIMKDNLDFAAVLKTSKAMDRKKIIAAIAKDLNQKEKEVKHEGGTIYVFSGPGAKGPSAIYFASDKVVLTAQKEESIKDVLRQAKKPAKHPALTRGIQMTSAGKHQLVVAFELKKDLMANIPPEMKEKAPNLAETNGVILAGTLANDLALEAVLTFATQDVAAKAKKDTDSLVAEAKLFIKGPKAPPAAGKFMDSITIDQRGAEVVVKAKMELDLKGFGDLPGFPFAGGGGPGLGGPDRARNTNNLKQIGLAMHSFHAANNSLPNHAIRDPKTGQAILSWRVALLPYLEQQALYKQIRQNERWDSQHNRQFWNQMPVVYLLPRKPNDGRTYYQVFHGDRSAFPKATRPAKTFPMVGDIGIVQISDGTTNTIFVVEAAASVNWMQPDDIPFQMGQPGLINRVGNHWGDNTFDALMGSGTVRRMRRDMTQQTLQALITRNGGEIVNDIDWEPKR
jgi:hypothetical protein